MWLWAWQCATRMAGHPEISRPATCRHKKSRARGGRRRPRPRDFVLNSELPPNGLGGSARASNRSKRRHDGAALRLRLGASGLPRNNPGAHVHHGSGRGRGTAGLSLSSGKLRRDLFPWAAALGGTFSIRRAGRGARGLRISSIGGRIARRFKRLARGPALCRASDLFAFASPQTASGTAFLGHGQLCMLILGPKKTRGLAPRSTFGALGRIRPCAGLAEGTRRLVMVVWKTA